MSDTEAERYAEGYAAGAVSVLDVVGTLLALVPGALVPGAWQVPTMARLADVLATVDPAHLHTLKPYTPAETATPKQAAGIAGVSESTIRGWAERYRIGRRVVGSLRISRPALAMLLDDQPGALAAYLSGDRVSPLVAAYFDRTDLTRVAVVTHNRNVADAQ